MQRPQRPQRTRTQPGTRPTTPEHAWAVLRAGNARFMADARAHPHEGLHVRKRLAGKQNPFAIFFGCADSRVGAEIIFDQGLGDLFVIRTAGHVIDLSVLGSIEYGIAKLHIPLIVVLGHDSCGAITATAEAVATGDMPGGFIRDIVERVTPSLFTARRDNPTATVDEIETEHIRQTATLLAERSSLIATRIAEGRLAIAGAQYALAEGEARLKCAIGPLGETPTISDV
ncbi:MAG TPA: carbonic anhydrase [Phycicoccus sp.]|jgi:carbonic anhydrase|nr:carbonic anhydrase [Phycicoccus sp.]HQY96724.1 carbonic anhydrase [Phycicoccus sp.]